jgi:uncharacterized protein
MLRILNPLAGSEIHSGHCAFGIMTKAPEAGKVKTRLTPPLTPEEAAQLNICFLRDLARSIAMACEKSRSRGVGVYTPTGTEASYNKILPPDFFLIPQRGVAFGERLALAAEDLFKAGFQSVCLINSDSPTIPASSFVEAAHVLAKPGDRVVLGPTDDGGYFLIGLKKLHPRLFEEIDWSTERVFAQTVERAAQSGVTIHKLPAGYDIDDRATLRRLCDELLADQTRSTTDLAPSSRKLLSDVVKKEGRDRIWPV